MPLSYGEMRRAFGQGDGAERAPHDPDSPTCEDCGTQTGEILRSDRIGRVVCFDCYPPG